MENKELNDVLEMEFARMLLNLQLDEKILIKNLKQSCRLFATQDAL